MPSPWSFAPTYDITLDKVNPKAGQRGQPPRLAYQLRTLVEFQGLLVTTNGVNNATLSFWDATGALMRDIDPQPMDAIQVRLNNRHGTWATAWSGYVDECHEIHDPAQGRMVTLKCSGPYVKFETGRQTQGDVIALAVASMQNVAGSEVVAYAARAVGYNPANITFDPVADSGTGLLSSISAGNYSDPAQQTWSAVVQQVLGSSGLEFFFDEEGYGHYRRVGFLGTGQRVIPRIPLEEVLHVDLGRAHRELVTSVEVRWGLLPATQTAAKQAAPAGMVSHLGTRPLVIHAPWLLSQKAAQYLATTLLDQYASGAATASVIVVADAATYRAGTVVEVPGVRKGQGATRYYISSVTYLCQWGGQWIQTLGLTFGRAPGNVFPYVGNVTYPVLTATAADLPRIVPLLAFDPTNSSKVQTPLTVVAQSGLAINQASSSALPVGSVIELRVSPTGGGQWVGPSHQYRVVAAPVGQSPFTIGLKSTGGSGTAYATIVSYGDGDVGDTTTTATGTTPAAPSNTTPSGPPTLPPTGPKTTPPGTGHGTQTVAPDFSATRANAAGTLALRAMMVGYSVRDAPGQSHYILGSHGEVDANGVQHWDCSGLVEWSFAQLGRPDFIRPSGRQYYYILAHGGRAISVDAAQPGDLLFIGPGEHVAWCWKAGGFNGGQTYGANNSVDGLRVFDIAGYHGESGAPFNLAIDMSRVTLTS